RNCGFTSSLHSELTCPVCLDMLKNTTQKTVYLSVFFADCIVTALRGGGKQIENYSGAEVSGDSSHCSKTSMYTAPSNKQTKTSDDSGNAKVTSDPIMDHASDTELVLRLHPTFMEKDETQTRFMKSSGNATVDHLSKHLAVSKGESSQTNLDTASKKQYAIYIATARGQFSVFNGSFSSELVSEKHWKVDKPMELHYAPTKEHK
ncbi:hypothetical protein K5549_021401, partial [Capra hircus]